MAFIPLDLVTIQVGQYPATVYPLFAHFDWAVYGFNSGHFMHTIRDHGLPFHIVLVANPFAA
jgi:hypothetical protein